MQNAGLDESPAGIKIAGRNISNLRYADDATLMAESEEKLKSLLMKVKEESRKSWLKTFPKMGKEILTQVQETQRVPNRIKPRRNPPRHTPR